MIQNIPEKIVGAIKDSSNRLKALNKYHIYDTEFFWGGSSLGYQAPVFINGDNSVVIKMRNDQYEKFAFKCYVDNIGGLEERYNLIRKNIIKSKSQYLLDVNYYPSELILTEGKCLPVLKMKWQEGVDLYTYIETYLHDDFELKLLTYNFSQFVKWLIEQPFAHGSICTDNLIVNANGDIFAVDYDNMYTPEMEGLRAKFKGDKNFVHPEMDFENFDKTIDTVPLLVTLLSLVTITTYPELYNSASKENHCLFNFDELVNLPLILPTNILHKNNENIREIYGMLMCALGNKKYKLTSDMINISNPIYDDPNRITIRYGEGHFNMHYVEAGSYYCGATSDTDDIKFADNIEDTKFPINFDLEAEIDEEPVKYESTEGFWISESLIKNSVWDIRKYGENDYYRDFNWSSLNWPVMSVQYEEAIQFARELSESFGLYFDLPTEKEWEFAAKGGNKSKKYKFSGSDNIDAVAVHSLKNNEHLTACPLKTKDPNELGIYDMSGLLYEFCKDEYSPKSFKTYSKPFLRHLQKNQKFHVRRGGCMLSKPHECRITCRRRENIFKLYDEEGYTIDSLEYYDPNTRTYIDDTYFHNYTGIRLVLHRLYPDTTEKIITPIDTSIKNKETYKDDYSSTITSDGKIFISCDEECKNLVIKKGVEVTAQGCCEYNENIISIEFPNTLKIICSQSFLSCKYLESISLQYGIHYIGAQAFCHCSKLKEIELPQSLRFMDSSAFSGCSSLKKIVIPDSVEQLGVDNFAFCCSLETINIPQHVKKIPLSFLRGCKSLKHITIPKSVEIIEGNPFCESGIRNIECKSKYYVFEKGFLMTKDRKQIVACLSDGTNIEVPSGIEIIGTEAFEGLTELRSVTLPDGLKEIERSAFRNCTSLDKLNIPSSVKCVAECICGCKKLKTIYIECPYESLHDFSFYNTSIENIFVDQDIEKYKEKYSNTLTKVSFI